MLKVMESQPLGFPYESAKNQRMTWHIFLNITVLYNEKSEFFVSWFLTGRKTKRKKDWYCFCTTIRKTFTMVNSDYLHQNLP